jgi:hypothetical protein
MRMLISIVAGLSMAGAAMAQTPAQAPATAPAPVLTVKAGDTAPAFSLQGSDGKTHTLADFTGRKAVVLAWYPKAFTGG